MKDTEINISALEETFPVTEAANQSQAFALMLAFTVTFTFTADQQISILLLQNPKKRKDWHRFQPSEQVNANS